MDTASSLIKALDVLTVVAGQPEGIQLPELVRAMHQPRSNVVRIVNTLVVYGLLEKHRGVLRLTAAFHDWAQRGRHAALRVKYRPVLETVAAQTGELVLLGLHEGNGVVHIDYIDSDHAVRVAPAPVTRHNLRVNALGKLALSRRADLSAKITDAKLLAELETIRRTGVAWNREESVKGMIALACPGFTDLPTEPMLAVAWPAYRFTEKKGLQCIRAIRQACDHAGGDDVEFHEFADGGRGRAGVGGLHEAGQLDDAAHEREGAALPGAPAVRRRKRRRLRGRAQ